MCPLAVKPRYVITAPKTYLENYKALEKFCKNQCASFFLSIFYFILSKKFISTAPQILGLWETQ